MSLKNQVLQDASCLHLLLWNMYVCLFSIFYSPATSAEVVHHAYQFLMRKESVLSDTTYTEFDDFFLTQNVKSIAVIDIDSMQTNSTTNQVRYSKPNTIWVACSIIHVV